MSSQTTVFLCPFLSVVNCCRQMDVTKQDNSLIMKGRGKKSISCVGSEVDLFCSTLFIRRGHNNDHPSYILSVIIIDLVSTFFNLLTFCLSFCPQSCRGSQSNTEGLINNGGFGWCLSLWDSLDWYICLFWRNPTTKLYPSNNRSHSVVTYSSPWHVKRSLLSTSCIASCYSQPPLIQSYSNYMLFKVLDE